MSIKAILGATGLALALVAMGCEKKEPAAPPEPAKPEEPAPVASDPFASAALFNCEGVGEIAVIFDNADPRKARIKLADGKVLELPAQQGADEPAYTDGTNSFVSPGDASMILNTGTIKASHCTPVSREVPPPKIDGAVKDIRADAAGSTVEIRVGERFSISLSGVPTAGYVWAPDKVPPFLNKVAEAGGPTSTAQFQPGFAGGNHWEVLGFEATKAGEGELELVQKRPWEDKADPSDQRFKVKVKVQ